MTNIKKLLINISVSVLTILLVLVVFEIGLRIAGINCLLADGSGESLYTLRDDTYFMRPHFDGRLTCTEFDVSIKTNSDGYRDDNFVRDDGKNVIIILGDSMTFGYGVEHEEIYSEVLESEIKDEGFVVHNLGTPGYSLHNYIGQLEQYGNEFNPQTVVITLFEGNDAQENCGLINRVNFFEAQRSGFGKVKDLAKETYLAKFMEPLVKNLINLDEGTITSKKFYLAEEPSGVTQCNNELKNNMLRLINIARRQGSELVFVIIPSKALWIENTDPVMDYTKKLNTMLGYCNDLEATCLNLKDLMEDHTPYYFGEAHINIEGHKLVATLIKEFMNQQNTVKE